MSTCRSCGAAIRWAETLWGKRIPCDAAPHAEGNIQINESGGALVYGHGVARPAGPLYRSHFATCPHAAQHRRAR